MRVWRLCRRRYQALTGEGARLFGGRWNSRGIRVVYASATLSLAALEFFVHLDPDVRPDDLVSIPAEIPLDWVLETLDPSDLPRNWRAYPPPEDIQQVGDTWLRTNKSVILAVPSVIIPHENNFLINPEHPDFSRIRVGSSEPFTFDPRMWKP